MARRAGALALLLVGVACTSATSSPGTSPSPTGVPRTPSTSAPAGGGTLGLLKIAAIDAPIAMAYRPDDASLYVAEQTGRIWRIREEGEPVAVLDIGDEVSDDVAAGVDRRLVRPGPFEAEPVEQVSAGQAPLWGLRRGRGGGQEQRGGRRGGQESSGQVRHGAAFGKRRRGAGARRATGITGAATRTGSGACCSTGASNDSSSGS